MTDTQRILQRYLKAFKNGQLDAIMAEYDDSSVFFTPNGPLRGPVQIREIFVATFAEFAKAGARFVLTRSDVIDQTAYITWSAETADNVYELGTDTSIVSAGKIHHHTFAGHIVPKR